MKQYSKRDSYSSADNFPVKLIQNKYLLNYIVENGIIPPIHIQFIPTNRCNLKCEFCSCKNEDKNKEIDVSLAIKIISMFSELGTKAVTITGGGEPLLHKNIESIINEFHSYSIEIGLVTNGTLFEKCNNIDLLTWCRISHADDRMFTDDYKRNLEKVVNKNKIDWAFSYVMSENPNYENIMKVIDFANKNDFTHVRIVSDIIKYSNIPSATVEARLLDKIDCSNVIFQSRDKPTHGGNCYICYLKPVISADGKIYTCCGAQYALDGSDRKMPDELCLGEFYDMKDIMKTNFIPFNGSICDVCYYSQYNKALELMLRDVNHKNFV